MKTLIIVLGVATGMSNAFASDPTFVMVNNPETLQLVCAGDCSISGNQYVLRDLQSLTLSALNPASQTVCTLKANEYHECYKGICTYKLNVQIINGTSGNCNVVNPPNWQRATFTPIE